MQHSMYYLLAAGDSSILRGLNFFNKQLRITCHVHVVTNLTVMPLIPKNLELRSQDRVCVVRMLDSL